MTRETMFKKVVAWLICAVMIIGMIPNVPVSAASDWEGDIDVVAPGYEESNPAEAVEGENVAPDGAEAFYWVFTPDHDCVVLITEGDTITEYTAAADTPIYFSSLNCTLAYKLGGCATQHYYFLSSLNNIVTNKGTMYYNGYFSGTTMTVTGEGDFDVVYNGETLASTDGVVETSVATANPRMPVEFSIIGDGEYTIVFTYPVGSSNNPDTIVSCGNGDNVAAIEAGNTQGYLYNYTAPNTCDLVIEISSDAAGWMYTINNMTSYKYGDTQWSDSDPVVNPAVVAVNAGDALEINVNTYDPADSWNTPKGNVTLKVHANTTTTVVAATCEADGSKTIVCNDCGATVYEEVLPTHPNLEYVAEIVPANCSETGHSEYWYCADCDCYFGSADAGYQINPDFINYTGDHVRSEDAPVCGTAPCTICGEDTYGSESCTPEGPVCKDSTCTVCGQATFGWGCEYNTYAEGTEVIPLCMPGTCIYCGTEYADGIYPHENGAWAPCLEGECSHGCGLTYPATADHVAEDPCVGGICIVCYNAEVEGAHTVVVDAAVEATCQKTGLTEGSHCSVCDEVIVAQTETPIVDHVYVDGVCQWCGAADPDAGPAVDANLKFYTVGLSFAEYIGIQPLLMKSAFSAYDSIYVEAVQISADGTKTTTVLEPIVFASYNVYDMQMLPKLMTDEVILTIYGEKDGVQYQSEPYSTSIRALAMSKIEEYYGKSDLVTCKILVDLLNYGAEVQLSFTYNTTDLANANLGEYASLGTSVEPTISGAVETSGSGIAVISNSLSLGSKVEIQFMFKATDVEGCELRYTIGGETVTIPASDFIPYSSYAVASFALKPRNFRDQITIAVYNSTTGEAVSAVYTASVEAYSAANIAKGNRVDLLKAMMKYGDAVIAKFAS